MPKAGFDRLAPSDGAFYIYAEIGHLTNDSQEFCRRMLDEHMPELVPTYERLVGSPGSRFTPPRT